MPLERERFLYQLAISTSVSKEACREFMQDMGDFIWCIALHFRQTPLHVAIKVLRASVKTKEYNQLLMLGLTPDDEEEIVACIPSRDVGLALLESAEPVPVTSDKASEKTVTAEELKAIFGD